MPSFKQICAPPAHHALMWEAYRAEIKSERKFELGTMNRIFLGKAGMRIYYVLFIIGLESVLCTFIMLFSTSLLVNVPIGPM